MHKKIIKSTLIILIFLLILGAISACDTSSTPSSENAPSASVPQNVSNPLNTCVSVYDISTSVQEQTRSKYDKYVDKNNEKWENEWVESSASPTALVKIGIQSGSNGYKIDNYNGVNAIGIDQTSGSAPVSVALTLLDDSAFSNNSCQLNTSSQRVYKGVDSGAIGSGMLIIEKSYDKTNWSRMDSDEYQSGLFTTNFRYYYGSGNTVSVYSPSGADLNQGVYIRVTYVYEAKYSYIGKNIFGSPKTKTEDKMYREQSVFYMCNENIDAVTLHNLSLTNENFPADTKNDQGDVSAEYKYSETLIDGSVTITGFKIENQLANVKVAIAKNGYRIDIPQSCELREDGLYEISIAQTLGTRQKTIKIHVDKRSADELKAYYFNEGFITGKRIFSEGTYPVFEGGYTNYQIAATDTNFPAIYGDIVNTTTGNTIKIFGDYASKSGTLLDAGEYVATFYTNPTFNTETPAGDTVIITYRFILIAQGTAPGPQVNKESLTDFAQTNVSDYYPKYYGVTFSSAGPGNITLVFSNYQDAFAFAYNYEKGCVERQPDGTYRYSGTLQVSSKEKYNSVWDLTDAMNYFADLAVQKLYFDLTDDFTYVTLEEAVVENYQNLRTLELSKSVVVFQSEEIRLHLSTNNLLPNISAKKYQYLTPGLDGSVVTGHHDFEFVKDENGYDSASITIIDALGKEIPIQYNTGVAAQLKAVGCVTGIITIREATIYGDTTEYRAIYIADGTNTTVATISYTRNGIEHTITVSQGNVPSIFEAGSFSFNSLNDDLDPLSLVKVISNQKENLYTFEEALTMNWSSPGEYTIVFINRMGYSYSLQISIIESNFINISFSGIGVDEFETIVVGRGDAILTLPQPTRYGFNLLGYMDQDGNTYSFSLLPASLSGDLLLSPIWRAKEFSLTIKDNNGTVLQTMTVTFGNSYVLTTPMLPEGAQFTGWILNGQTLESGVVTVDQETDIVVIADIKYVQGSEQPPTEVPESPATNGPILEDDEWENNTQSEEAPSSFWSELITYIIIFSVVILVVWCFEKRKH